MMERNSDHRAELIASLLSHVPEFYDRIASVLAAGTLPGQAYEAAFQIAEFLAQEFPTPLRKMDSVRGST
jgi:hypothetical protein